MTDNDRGGSGEDAMAQHGSSPTWRTIVGWQAGILGVLTTIALSLFGSWAHAIRTDLREMRSAQMEERAGASVRGERLAALDARVSELERKAEGAVSSNEFDALKREILDRLDRIEKKVDRAD